MEGYHFRFSRDLRFGREYHFKDFIDMSRELCKLVSSTHPTIESNVLSQLDRKSYDFSGVLPDDERLARLGIKIQPKISTPLSEFTEEQWKSAPFHQYTATDDTAKNHFMVNLHHEKREPGKIFFYGQGLDAWTHIVVTGNFKKAGLLHSVGDGYPKTSPGKMNLALARLSLFDL